MSDKERRDGKRHDPHAAREAARYDNPIPSREAIIDLLDERGELLKFDAIAEALGLTEQADLDALGKRLAAMVRDGQLLRNRREGYAVADKLDLIRGEVIANADGYGFLQPDDGSEDLYLSPHEMRKVLNGDTVLASVVSVDSRGRKAAIAEVLARGNSRIVGRVVTDKGVTTVVPDDDRLHQDILIAPGEAGEASEGQIVIAEITEQPSLKRGPVGRIVRVLGDKLEPSLVVNMAIAQYDLREEWPNEVVDQVQDMPVGVTDADREGREDLREMPLVTIDGEDSRDFDDAVWAEPQADGNYRLVVAIADVSHYVQPDDDLDDEAWKRGTSTYFPGYVLPMLPEALSNGLCSLNPGLDRLCMVCDMTINPQGEVTQSRFYEGVMRSAARLTYNQVWHALGPKDKKVRDELGDLMPMLEDCYALYKILDKARAARGAIEFDSGEVRFFLNDEGQVEHMQATERNDAHKIIEEFMIAANVEAARFLERKKIPSLYRVHAPPPARKYEELTDFLRQYKLKLPPVEKVMPSDYCELVEKVRDEPWGDVVQSMLLRSMSRAMYMAENNGHFGLALQAYTHFTAPIRRYPDVLVHRAIRYALSGGKPSGYMYNQKRMGELGIHCSTCERRSDEAERDVDERFKCAWMEKHVGEVFTGHVTWVTSYGLFVELDKSKVSGLVHVTQLPNDYYHFKAEKRLLKGQHTGRLLCLGDEVRVRVLQASMIDREVDLRMESNETRHGQGDGRR